MLIDDQSKAVQALSRPEAYGLKGKKVEVRESNISTVFLAGDKAYKLKRGVKYPYVDYSTLEKRRDACEKELLICRGTAPGLCVGVETVVLDKGGKIKIGSQATDKNAEIIDYLLVMNRFDEADLFENLAEAVRLDRFEMMDLAEKMVELHKNAEVFKHRGGAAMIRGRILENDELMRCFVPEIFDPDDIDALKADALEALEKYAPLLDERKAEGKVRWCHGDVHFHNIVMLNGKPALFDPVEFNDELTHIDILYDLAFLLMDMEIRGLRRLSSILFNHYMAYSADWEGVPALPLFLSCRAAVNAYVYAQRSSETKDKELSERLAKQAYEYLVTARRFLNPPLPVLVACGGLSGSGKSRIGRELAPFIGSPPGAVILRDDVLRKNMLGVDPDDSLGEEAYTPENEAKVFELLCTECRRVLATGQSVVADALFHDENQRKAIEALAEQAGVEFRGFWVDAPLEIRKERVASRKRNPSDVKTAAVLEKQLDIDVGNITWDKVDTSGDRLATLAYVRSLLAEKKQGNK